MAVPWYAVLLLTATALAASIASTKTSVESTSCGRVWLTVHSPEYRLSRNINVIDALELNWDYAGCSYVPHRIGLFPGRPISWGASLATFPILSEEGYVVTNVTLGKPILPGGWHNGTGVEGTSCYWAWVGAGDKQIVTHNCLKIHPTWMQDHADRINGLKVGQLAIPGTHNAGAWKFNTEHNNLSRDVFVLCQDRSIWSQLVHGIRYFDFRIAYYDLYDNVEDRYWLNHNLVRVRPLLPLLREIRAFLDSTKEVVFLDAHHFPIGFYETNNAPINEVHAGLLELVQRELGPHIATAKDFYTGQGTLGPTLKTLIDADKRLLFSYVDNKVVAENSWLWPSLPHLWANTNNPETMLDYLDITLATYPLAVASARSPMYSAMAQTTPTVVDILFLRGSLRDNANAVNRNVTQKLKTTWKQTANIVSTDFFLGNDVTEVSILLNLERGSL